MTNITSAAFRVGDTVEVIARDANRWGDIGNVTEIDSQLDTLRVTFGGSGSDWFDPHELRRLNNEAVCPRCNGDEFIDYSGLLGEGPATRIPCPVCTAKQVDADLTATAQEIKRLQSIIEIQRLRITRAETRADLAEAARDDYLDRLDSITEKYKAAQILLEGVVAPKAREVCTLVQSLTMTGQRISADKELAERLNEGWEVLNITITSVPLNDEGQEMLTRIVTLSRECPAPSQEMPTVQHGTIIIQPAPFPPMKPAPAITAMNRFAQMKAESDARVEAAAPYSPLTMAVVNYLKVQS